MKLRADALNHFVEIGLLISAQEILQIFHVIFVPRLNSLAKALKIQSGSSALPELENGKRTDEALLQGTAGKFRQIVEVTNF